MRRTAILPFITQIMFDEEIKKQQNDSFPPKKLSKEERERAEEVAKMKAKEKEDEVKKNRGLKPFHFEKNTYWAVNEKRARFKYLKDKEEVEKVKEKRDYLKGKIRENIFNAQFYGDEDVKGTVKKMFKEQYHNLGKDIKKDLEAIGASEKYFVEYLNKCL